jgi:hypothetical protein
MAAVLCDDDEVGAPSVTQLYNGVIGSNLFEYELMNILKEAELNKKLTTIVYRNSLFF